MIIFDRHLIRKRKKEGYLKCKRLSGKKRDFKKRSNFHIFKCEKNNFVMSFIILELNVCP